MAEWSHPHKPDLYVLRLFNRAQLREINERLPCLQLDEDVTWSNEDFLGKFRTRLETALTHENETNWEAFVNYYRDEFIGTRAQATDERIELVLEETPLMPLDKNAIQIGQEIDEIPRRKEELWFSSQLYGAMVNEFNIPTSNDPHRELPHSDHEIVREHEEWGIYFDLFVRNNQTEEPYIIEVKRQDRNLSPTEVAKQLYRYNTVFEERQHTYLLLVEEISQESSDTADEQDDIESLQEQIKGELNNMNVDETTVLKNAVREH